MITANEARVITDGVRVAKEMVERAAAREYVEGHVTERILEMSNQGYSSYTFVPEHYNINLQYVIDLLEREGGFRCVLGGRHGTSITAHW